VKNFKFIKSRFLRTFSVYFTCLILINSIILFFSSSTLSDYDQNNYPQLINQENNSTADSLCNKVNIKLLSGTNSVHFYSFEYHFKKLGRYPKIFTIISETDSEQNIRHSSFLLTQSKTST
jgi:hypothetical protein